MDNSLLYNKLMSLPDHLKAEVSDFIDFLKSGVKMNQESSKQKPQFGAMKGMIEMAPDFDEPLSDFKDYMP